MGNTRRAVPLGFCMARRRGSWLPRSWNTNRYRRLSTNSVSQVTRAGLSLTQPQLLPQLATTAWARGKAACQVNRPKDTSSRNIMPKRMALGAVSRVSACSRMGVSWVSSPSAALRWRLRLIDCAAASAMESRIYIRRISS